MKREAKYPIGDCVSEECWQSIVRWQAAHYGSRPEKTPLPMPELEDVETIGREMAAAPESQEHMR